MMDPSVFLYSQWPPLNSSRPSPQPGVYRRQTMDQEEETMGDRKGDESDSRCYVKEQTSDFTTNS